MELKNCMEDAVNRYVDDIIKELDMCTCEKCKLDVMAIALNNLPPQYTVTDDGFLFNKLKTMELQFEIEIIAEITRAAKIVMKDSRHYEKEEE